MNACPIEADPVVPPAVDAPAPKAEEPRPLWHMPLDIRSASLSFLAALASLYTLYWAKEVFIPVLLGLMSSYALTPVVDRLERLRIPRTLASALLLLSIVGALGGTAHTLSDDATELIASLPKVAQKFRQTMRTPDATPKSATSMDQVQQAASELEKAAEASAGSAVSGTRGVTWVQLEKPKFRVQDYFWTGTLGLAALAGQAVAVLFLTFFLLSSGTNFRRKIVKIAGPSASTRRGPEQRDAFHQEHLIRCTASGAERVG